LTAQHRRAQASGGLSALAELLVLLAKEKVTQSYLSVDEMEGGFKIEVYNPERLKEFTTVV